jgi:two-component system OmpR family response regulator
MTVRNTLIVEDNPNIAGLLSLHLGDMGYSVRVSGDGISGLSLARSAHPGLIILDLMLPPLNSMAVCRQLRQDANYEPDSHAYIEIIRGGPYSGSG